MRLWLGILVGVAVIRLIDRAFAWWDARHPIAPYPLEFRIAQAINADRSTDAYVSALDVKPAITLLLQIADRKAEQRRREMEPDNEQLS
jgi:hypothetical protein